MKLIKRLQEKAKTINNKIVLPEGTEPRILKAASIIKKENIAEIIILGNENEISSIANKEKINIENMEIIDPEKSTLIKSFANDFYNLRKHKGITLKEAENIIKDPLYFGTMLVHTNRCQGLVAGAVNPTGHVIRPAFQIIRTSEKFSVASGLFVMDVPDCKLGQKGTFIFADCAVNPSPDSKQLAEIAVSSSITAKKLLGIDPVVALLSYSTKGSASGKLVDKVREAVDFALEMQPDLLIDGELQLDAAIVPSVAQNKAPDSNVAGKANVLIFPDLQAGNIGYKLVERLANAVALGPILQGLAKPVNDLSRGCSVEDIVNVVAITSIQARE